MVGPAALMLAEGGVTKFFENPAVLLGIPLVVLGAIGLLVALSPIGIARPSPPEKEPLPPEATSVEVQALPGADVHPGPETYVKVGLALAVATMIEVAVYYVNLVQGALIALLLTFSAMKFLLVVLWFMHLRFDSRLFSTLFAGGFALAVALFFVVLATLGASLV